MVVTVKEARCIIADVMNASKINPSIWGTKKQSFQIIYLNEKVVEVKIPHGMSYYEMKKLEAHIEQIASDFKKSELNRKAGQLDIETAFVENVKRGSTQRAQP